MNEKLFNLTISKSYGRKRTILTGVTKSKINDCWDRYVFNGVSVEISEYVPPRS